MHDLLEGVIPKTVKSTLSAVISHRRCSLDDINKTLKVASVKVNKKPVLLKPSMLKESGSLVGSASQKWSLFLLLPELISCVRHLNYLDQTFQVVRCIVLSGRQYNIFIFCQKNWKWRYVTDWTLSLMRMNCLQAVHMSVYYWLKIAIGCIFLLTFLEEEKVSALLCVNYIIKYMWFLACLWKTVS